MPGPTEGPFSSPLSQTVMTFGHNGFLGYTPCNSAPALDMITNEHICGSTVVPRGDMAFWWARSAHVEPKRTPEVDVEDARRELEERMKGWSDPNIRKILRETVKTAMIPTYALPRQERWSGRRVVLVGDAAHGECAFLDPAPVTAVYSLPAALPTSSGQGVSQSLEDAEALALLLAHHFAPKNDDSTPSPREMLQKVFEQYTTVRKAHVERILDAGNRGGDASRDMNVVAEYAMYAFLWVICESSTS